MTATDADIIDCSCEKAFCAIATATAVLRRCVSAGEIEDMTRVLPDPIRALLL